MANKKDKYGFPVRSEYSLRTLAYYQKQGGIYSNIITILMKLRDDPATSRVLAPNKVLNEASWLFDVNEALDDPEKAEVTFMDCWDRYMYEYNPKDRALIKCVCFVLLNYPYKIDAKELCPQMDGVIQPMTLNSIQLCMYLEKDVLADKLFWPKFKHLHNTEYLTMGLDVRPELTEKIHQLEIELVESRFTIEELKAKIEELENINLAKDAEIRQLNHDLAEARETIASIPTQSELDSNLTFKRIIDYIKSCQQYKFTNQIFMMMSKFMRRCATDEEYQLLDETEQYMQAQKSGDVTNINNNTGCNVINEARDPVFGDPIHKA